MLLTGSAAGAKPSAILIFGDSLSAEYGLPRGTGWVQLLSGRLAKEAGQYSVVNASISGETTSGGRTRLPQLLQRHRPSIVVLQLGANDGLRGLSLASMRDNLAAMIEASREAGARVLLVGMRIPPNYGRGYAERFAGVYAQLASDQKVALVPFLLDGFADDLEFFQADRIHPNERAQTRMLDTVWPQLAPLLRSGRR
ncbi:MAG: arylesterase [Burkholderiales bacterium]|nr:MAG: arylesterase [Burkholderiales bacterium]